MIQATNMFQQNYGWHEHLKNGSTYSSNEFSFACFTNKHLLIRCALVFGFTPRQSADDQIRFTNIQESA